MVRGRRWSEGGGGLREEVKEGGGDPREEVEEVDVT